MRNKLFLCLLAIVILASGCARNPRGTLASMDKPKLKIEKNAKIDSAQQKATDNYWEFINSAPKDSLKVEALRRLGDIELERSEDKLQKKIAKMDKDSMDPGTLANKEAELKGNSYDTAIKLYEDAVAASVGEPDDAQLFYQLSQAYERAGKPRKALEALNRLLQRFPDLDNRDEVHFRRGELLFSLNDFDEAEKAYTQAMVVDPSSAFYEKALSKKGWSAYKLNKYDRALHSFFTILDRKLRGTSGEIDLEGDNLSRGDKELVSDIFRVVTLSFNELGGPDAVTRYFSNNGNRNYESVIYRNLGDHYLEKGRIRDAAIAYKAFVQQYPDHGQAPQFDMYQIDAFGKGGFPSLLIEAKISFCTRYAVDGDYWKAHSEPQHEKLLPLLQKNMEEVAQHFHAVAQKSKKSEDYRAAVGWYEKYIASFPQAEKTPHMNFLLAEILFDDKQFELAAKEYEKTAYQYPKYGKNAEAGYAALLAYTERAKQLDGKQKEIWERLAIGSALRFGKAFPNDKHSPAVVTKAAEDLFALKKYDQAAVAARSILELTADTKLSMRRTAWLIVAQAELQTGHYARAESAYKIALKLTKPDDKQRPAIEQGLAASIYKLGEQARDTGDLQGAAKHFSRVALVAPNSDIAITAQYDMAVSFIQKQDWKNAIDALEAFRNKYPTHNKYHRPVTENLALAYTKIDKPINAAREFETMIAYQTNIDVRRDMARRIAELYEQAGAKDDTINAYKQFLDRFPNDIDQAMEARQKLADIYLANNQGSKRNFWLRQIVSKDKSAGGSRTDRSRYLAAKASLELARPRWDSFAEIKLVAPFKENLKKKKQKLEEAVNAYTTAADYGVEEVTTASIYWLGEIYNKFGKELLNSERPKDLSTEELDQYNILLEEQAYPFEEKSINIHEGNVDRIKDGTYDEWVKKSLAALRVLRPVRYAKAERSELFAEYIK